MYGEKVIAPGKSLEILKIPEASVAIMREVFFRTTFQERSFYSPTWSPERRHVFIKRAIVHARWKD